MNLLQENTAFIKKTAGDLGFEHCGISKAAKLDADAARLEKWLHQGMHGSMQYMENHFDLRIDPSKLVPGARSVITLLKNYYPSQQQQPNTPGISKYAFGKDYHEVIKTNLHIFLDRIREKLGDIHGRGFVDSAPVLERSWAQRSGLGWVGKNGNLINKQSGSFYFIATLITDLSLAYDDPVAKDYCGTCTRCIDACPTDAILPDKVVDGSRCISYFTIELKEMLIPDTMKGKFDNWMFGCDTCQDVCPWNRFSKPTDEPAFTPLPEILDLSVSQWKAMTEESFKKLFRHSPLRRAKFSGIQRNLQFICNSTDETTGQQKI
ncbi:MAG: tRNA epoxyqueuosine(34) reductase QueG [Chitinophagaceae bacterium]|nr:tRNA epoxyqueuosine(34) reductase QueG [Chitinophagaceae bacterium]